MPELPEVETIVRYLKPKIRGRRILGVWSDAARLFRGGPGFAFLKKKISGKVIEDVTRAGKNIIFRLSGGWELAIHLMMTGKLLLNPPDRKEKHIHFGMKLGAKQYLALHDIRKFGRIQLRKQKIFINPSSDALWLDFPNFKNIFKNRKGIIKSLFLNQNIICGIGNIYADEIFWYAGIKPSRKVNTLSEKELRALYNAMKKVLRTAIKKGGTSFRDYRKPDGSEGGYYKIRKAYQRTGKRCSRCGGIIKRVLISQRATHYCPRHQR